MSDNKPETAENTAGAATAEIPKVRNFRNATDVENFYRFLNDNDLRKEAKLALETVLNKLAPKSKKRKKRNSAGKKKLQ